MSDEPTCPEHGDENLGGFGDVYETDKRIWWMPWRKRWDERWYFTFCMVDGCTWSETPQETPDD